MANLCRITQPKEWLIILNVWCIFGDFDKILDKWWTNFKRCHHFLDDTIFITWQNFSFLGHLDLVLSPFSWIPRHRMFALLIFKHIRFWPKKLDLGDFAGLFTSYAYSWLRCKRFLIHSPKSLLLITILYEICMDRKSKLL